MKRLGLLAILLALLCSLGAGEGVADYVNYRVHNLTSDNGALSGFGSITLGGETRTEWGTISYDNVAITGGTIDNTTVTLIDNSVLPTKLRYTTTPDNTLFYRGDGEWADPGVDFQTQLDGKQAYDADLAVLSFPTTWRIFYSNGSQAITELALGADNTCLQSNGASVAPSWGTCGTGGGGTTSLPWDNITSTPTTIAGYGITDAMVSDNVAITGGSIDNVTLQGVSSAYFDPTSSIQGQLDGKQDSSSMLANLSSGTVQDPFTFNDDVYAKFGTDNDITVRYKSADATLVIALDNGDAMCTFAKTGNLTCTGEITSSQYNSDGLDNTYGINVMNTADPTGANLEGGLFWFNGTSNVPKQRNADNTATYDVLTSGVAKFSKCTTIDNAVAASDYPIEKFPQAITITNVKVYAIGGDNVVGGLDECTGTNGVCSAVTAVDADITGTAGNEVSDDGSLTNPGIAAGNWIQWHTTSVSGTNTSLSVCFYYTLGSAY